MIERKGILEHGNKIQIHSPVTKMIGNTNTEMTAEIQELKEIISQHVRTEGNKRDLQTLLATKQQHAALAEDGKRNTSSVHLAPEPVKLSSTAPTKTSSGSDLTEFSSISRFGWEDEGTNSR